MLRLASLVGFAGFAVVSLGFSVTTAASANDYSSAFATATGAKEGAAPTATPDDDMNALRQLSSFPARVRLGEEDAGKGWSDPGERAYQPKPAARHFRAGGCEFTVRTGDFTLRRYEREGVVGEESLVVSKDPVARFSTLVAGRQPVFLSVNSELYVTVPDAQRGACKALFAGRRVRLGAADLGHTVLSAKDEAGGVAAAEPLRDAPALTVYLTWDSRRDQLVLVDEVGLAPAVESPVFTVNPSVAGDYYLVVEPQLGLDRPARHASR